MKHDDEERQLLSRLLTGAPRRSGLMGQMTSLFERVADFASILNAQVRMRMLADVPMSVRLRGRICIAGHGQITLGEGVSITGDIVPVELLTRANGNIQIGDRTFINYGTSISARSSVRIGRDCHLGHYTLVMDNPEHGILNRFEPPPSGPVVIEDSVWIGSRVVILPGVRIGTRAVVGAGSVVTRSIPAGCVAAGNPARVLRYLSDANGANYEPTPLPPFH